MGEFARLDELYKYFPAVYDRDCSLSSTAPGVTLCGDPILNALAQLGACRLDTERAFISLIDHENQYVVAESTRKNSLFDVARQAHAGGLAIGVQTFDLVSGICASTIPFYTDTTGDRHVSNTNMFADTARFIVNDLALEPDYKNKSCVQGFPHMRFYAAAAIRSSAGHVIGNFAAIDSRPHAGLSKEGHVALTEIANSVMRHLELLQIQKSHHGALQLLRGLETFVRHDVSGEHNGKSAHRSSMSPSSSHSIQKPLIHNSDRLQPHKSTNMQNVASHLRTENLQDHSQESVERSAPKQKQMPPMTTMTPSATSPDTILNTLSEEKRPAKTPSPDSHSVRSLDQYQAILNRAASLVRAAMRLDRVFFIKAPSSSDPSKSRSGSTSVRLADTANLPPEVQHDAVAESGLPISTDGAGQSSSSGNVQEDPAISEELHQDLLTQYPRGACFNFTNYARPEEDESDAKAALFKSLRSSLPPARSLLFQPLFGPDNKTSLRSMFAWSSEERRILQEEDLNYFRLFSATIEAKFSQVETAVQSRAKSDFISSISHELRSPLHGILGNAELLSHSSLDPDQEESVLMIQKSGGALLTTLDHVLIYSKINSRSRVQLLSLSSGQDTAAAAAKATIDLSMVVEDSVDTLISGNHFRKLTAGRGNLIQGKMENKASNGPKHGPLINLTIDAAPTWSSITEEAVWVRSVINILGNAIKYTESGVIELKLQMDTRRHTGSDPEKHLVKLAVSDTGRGMSSSYLQNHLYHAFSQENTTSDGLGLGLSIVKKLVEGLNGSIDISSTIGKGTVVEISAPVILGSSDRAEEQSPSSLQDKSICILGKLHQQSIEAGAKLPEISSQREITVLNSTLSKYCKEWFGMEVKYASTAESIADEAILILEEDLYLLEESTSKNQDSQLRTPKRGVIVVSTTSETRKRTSSGKNDGVFHLVPPFGPRRLASIIQQADNYRRDNSSIVNSLPYSNNGTDPANERLTSPKLHQKIPVQIPEHRNRASRGTHVLVVDDNEINVKLLCKSLNKWKITYETAFNGAEAVDAFQNCARTFDYILMDISMPVMNGIVATRAIRDLETSWEIFPRSMIIAMTGLGDEKTQQEAIASGMDIFLTKPIRLSQIKSLLNVS